MAANARHSIGNGGIGEEESQRLHIKSKNDGADKPSEPHGFRVKKRRRRSELFAR
ncbi:MULTISPECIES: hypothetical protein [unclassified Bradyrhizobium]|uniref:hypothetical protein n=1 Tax=unclassified Bradyrhizobium TaxID=2631580 RepID=UPI002916D096|nr:MULTISPECIES: hypothetical protein [unclassified Bradyrhizobium]